LKLKELGEITIEQSVERKSVRWVPGFGFVVEECERIGMESEELGRSLAFGGDLEEKLVEDAREREPLKVLTDSFVTAADRRFFDPNEFRSWFLDEPPLGGSKGLEGAPEAPRLDSVSREARDSTEVLGQCGHNPMALLVGHGS